MKSILFTLLISFPLCATEISRKNLFIPYKLGELSVVKKDQGFSVIKDGKEYPVANHNTDSVLRKINKKQLAAFLADDGGHIDVNELNEREYTLKAKCHGKGGGPITAAILYWCVKGLGYGVPAAVTGVTVAAAAAPLIAAGGIAGAVGGAGAVVGETLVGAATSTLVAGGAAATTGAGIVGGAVVGAVGAEAAAVGAGAVFAGAGCSAAGYIAAVETGATAAGAFGLAIPFLP